MRRLRFDIHTSTLLSRSDGYADGYDKDRLKCLTKALDTSCLSLLDVIQGHSERNKVADHPPTALLDECRTDDKLDLELLRKKCGDKKISLNDGAREGEFTEKQVEDFHKIIDEWL